MDAVALAAVAASSAKLSGGLAVAAFQSQVQAQKILVEAIQQLTSSGPGQVINLFA